MNDLAERIIKYFGDDLYTELDVTESDYDTLPAYDFYQKVLDSCKELHPEVIAELEGDDTESRGPWKQFNTRSTAMRFISKYIKDKPFEQIKCMTDVFHNPDQYDLSSNRSFPIMRSIFLTEEKQRGAKNFPAEILYGKSTKVLNQYHNITLGSLKSYMLYSGSRYYFQYALRKKLITYFDGRYYIDQQF